MAEEALDTPTNTDSAQTNNQQQAAPQVANINTQQQSTEAAKKLELANETEYKIHNFINEKLALIDEKIDSKTDFGMKIITYFIPKFNKGKDFYDANNAVNLTYSSMVKEIVLEDALDCIGLRGYIDVVDEGGVLEGVIERHNLFYLVINITEYIGNQSIKYEPYIFEIDSVGQITSSFRSGSRVVRFHLVDLITSILRSHSIASFIRFSGNDITKTKNYKLLFEKIIDYVRKFIKVNTDNVFEYKKDVFFDDKTMWKGKEKINGYDDDVDLSKLVTFSFNKLDKNTSIWEALQVFLKDCVTSIKMSDSIKQMFDTIGDVLIPFFFKEEYGDLQGVYSSLWTTSIDMNRNTESGDSATGGNSAVTTTPPVTQPQQTTPPADDTPTTRARAGETSDSSTDAALDSVAEQAQQSVSQDTQGTNAKLNGRDETVRSSLTNVKELVNREYGGSSNALVYRPITMRDFFMPFYLCFSQDVPVVFQEINNSSSEIKSIEPKINDNLQSLKFTTIDKKSVDKRWKNVVFIDANTSSVNSTMLFFDWFYRFFLRVFLNSSKMGGKQNFISNVIPDFYLFSLIHNIGGAYGNANETFDSLFDEYNSYTVATETTDTTNEALREMGKNLASLILLNDSYSFTIQGNIRRRPNEIIRLNVGDLRRGGESQLPLFTNLNQDACLYVYVRKITHRFKGNQYVNEIVTSKICESY